MPIITCDLNDITPNLSDFSENNKKCKLFSTVRKCSKKYNGTIKPLKRSEFVKAWYPNFIDILFSCDIQSIKKAEETLKYNKFKPCLNTRVNIHLEDIFIDHKKIRTITLCRIILAFNMYDRVRKILGLPNFNRIDLVGSTGNDDPHRNTIEKHCNNNILFLSDEQIQKFICLSKKEHIPGKEEEFWKHIFYIYDKSEFIFMINQN